MTNDDLRSIDDEFACKFKQRVAEVGNLSGIPIPAIEVLTSVADEFVTKRLSTSQAKNFAARLINESKSDAVAAQNTSA